MAALPYMQLYVADYLADTAHLNAEQHGAYLLLIMNYWQRGKALNNFSDRLANAVRMTSEQWEKNKKVISEFFEVDGDTWKHARIERDLARINAKSEKARNSASIGKIRKKSEQSANNQRTLSERLANDKRPPIYKDTDTDKDIKEKNTKKENIGTAAAGPRPAVPAGHDLLKTSETCVSAGSGQGSVLSGAMTEELPMPGPGGDSGLKNEKKGQGSESGGGEAEGFVEFWQNYPRRENKKKALEIWRRKKLAAKAQEIIGDIIDRKARHGPWKDLKFVPHPTTYLNGDRWNDEIIIMEESINAKCTNNYPKSSTRQFWEDSAAIMQRIYDDEQRDSAANN